MCPISTDGYRQFLLSAFLSEHIAEVTIFIQKKANKTTNSSLEIKIRPLNINYLY